MIDAIQTGLEIELKVHRSYCYNGVVPTIMLIYLKLSIIVIPDLTFTRILFSFSFFFAGVLKSLVIWHDKF